MFLNFLLLLIKIIPEDLLPDYREELKDDIKNKVTKSECLQLKIYYIIEGNEYFNQFLIIAAIFNGILSILISLISLIEDNICYSLLALVSMFSLLSVAELGYIHIINASVSHTKRLKIIQRIKEE